LEFPTVDVADRSVKRAWANGAVGFHYRGRPRSIALRGFVAIQSQVRPKMTGNPEELVRRFRDVSAADVGGIFGDQPNRWRPLAACGTDS